MFTIEQTIWLLEHDIDILEVAKRRWYNLKRLSDYEQKILIKIFKARELEPINYG